MYSISPYGSFSDVDWSYRIDSDDENLLDLTGVPSPTEHGSSKSEDSGLSSRVSSPSDQQQEPVLVGPGRPWRYTFGRASCAARSPLYALAAVFQVAKIIVKIPFSVVQLIVNGGINGYILIHNLFANCFNREEIIPRYFVIHDSWSFAGALRDGIMALDFVNRTVNCAWLALVAPPEHYLSFDRSFKRLCNTVFLDSHHTVKGKYAKGEAAHGEPVSVKELWDTIKKITPNYARQIFSRWGSQLEMGAKIEQHKNG